MICYILLDLQITKMGTTSLGTDYTFQKFTFCIINSQEGKKDFLSLNEYCSGLVRQTEAAKIIKLFKHFHYTF